MWLISILTIILTFVIIKIFERLTLGKCYCNLYLNGKTALITGGNSGFGYQTALALAGRGCRVIIADKDDCEKTKENIITRTGNPNIVTKNFNLASLWSVRKLAKDINETESRLDFLINNAGIGGTGKCYTEDGLDLGMQVNFFGHFLLTHLLIGLLKKSSPSKIIFVSSILAFLHNLSVENLNYPQNKTGNTLLTDLRIYANSKLCSIIAAKEFSRKLKAADVTAYAVHPGLSYYTGIFSRYTPNGLVVNIFYHIFNKIITKPFSKSPEEAIQTVLHVALCKLSVNHIGKFFVDCRVFIRPTQADDPHFTKKIWEVSEKYVKLDPNEII